MSKKTQKKTFSFVWELSGTVDVEIEAKNHKDAVNKMNNWTRNVCVHFGDDGEEIGEVRDLDVNLFDSQGNAVKW
jgi:hypothetical protein